MPEVAPPPSDLSPAESTGITGIIGTALIERLSIKVQNERESRLAMQADLRALQQSVLLIDNKIKPNTALWSMFLLVGLAVPSAILWFTNNQITLSIQPINARLTQVEAFEVESGRRFTTNETARAELAKDIGLVQQTQALSVAQLNRLSNALESLNAASAASSVADASSRNDRAQLGDRVRQLEVSSALGDAERRAGIAEIGARLLESEQQMHSISNIDNMRWSTQARENAMLYEKIHPGERYPTDQFFPTSIYQAAPQPLSSNTIGK